MLQSAALGALEDAINRGITLDSRAPEQLSTLNGKRFALQLQEPEIFLGIAIQSGHIRLNSDSQTKVDTRLSGSWAEFARIASADDPATALINGDITIQGDTAPLLELRNILSQLDLDWERPLANTFGDVVAHQIGSSLRAGQRWALQGAKTLRRQVEDFLLEESRLVPHPYQAEDFFRQIEDLRTRSERLEARLRSLSQRIAQQTEKN
ncbi:SCP2 sterol-binding domain-containing protein [Spongiibacter sp. KMU-158]|uniref:Ubiquinone biosynthesis accessory factor UbiJ n=2 Tax=Spongiibacter pelagi TaxID=2760804 RepID=A0A927BZK6_9GAMM|nr:SCP2 sterol-binding domain-containing protein [Spongiibacter pelagi]